VLKLSDKVLILPMMPL